MLRIVYLQHPPNTCYHFLLCTNDGLLCHNPSLSVSFSVSVVMVSVELLLVAPDVLSLIRVHDFYALPHSLNRKSNMT